MEITVDFLNKIQKKYFVASKLDAESQNSIYIGILRQFPNQIELNLIHDQTQNQNNDQNEKNTNNENIFHNINNPKIVKLEEINDFFVTKNCFALKLLPYNTQEEIEKLDNEKNIQDLFFDEEPIIKYKDFIDITVNNNSYILISMNLYVNFDLLFYMSRPTFCYDENFICIITYQCLTILKKLKERHIVHNDIKFENFIVVSESPFEISLTDFECAEMIQENELSSQFHGTSVFKSPEMLQGKLHDYSHDMWSLGINIYVSLFDSYPFEINDDDEIEAEIYDKINKNELVNDNSVSREAWKCIESMLIKDPNERITPEDALNLSWFSSIESTEIKVKTDSYDIKPLKSETTKA